MKLNYNTPILEIINFSFDDIIVTSPIGDPDFDATAPDFGWGNEEDGWPPMDF